MKTCMHSVWIIYRISTVILFENTTPFLKKWEVIQIIQSSYFIVIFINFLNVMFGARQREKFMHLRPHSEWRFQSSIIRIKIILPKRRLHKLVYQLVSLCMCSAADVALSLVSKPFWWFSQHGFVFLLFLFMFYFSLFCCVFCLISLFFCLPHRWGWDHNCVIL